jgi:hypothetical protein
MVIQLFQHSSENVCACKFGIFDTPIYSSSYYLSMIWISAYLNFWWVIHRRFNVSQSTQRTHACTSVLEYLCIEIHRSLPLLPLLWMPTYLNFQRMIYKPLYISQSKSSMYACAFALVFLGYLIYRLTHYLLMLQISTK